MSIQQFQMYSTSVSVVQMVSYVGYAEMLEVEEELCVCNLYI